MAAMAIIGASMSSSARRNFLPGGSQATTEPQHERKREAGRVTGARRQHAVVGRRTRSSWEWRDPLDPYEAAAYREHQTGRLKSSAIFSPESRNRDIVGGHNRKTSFSSGAERATMTSSASVPNLRERSTEGAPRKSSFALILEHRLRPEIEPTFNKEGEHAETGRIDGNECYNYVFWLMTKTSFGFYFDLWQAMLSVVACGVYVWCTYQYTAQTTYYPLWLVLFECTTAVFFTVELCLHLYLSPSRLQFMASGQFIVDVASIIPVVVVLYPDKPLGIIRLLRGIRVLRILRIQRLFQATSDQTDLVQRQIINVVLKLIAFMFICAGLLHTIDDVYLGDAFDVDEFFYFDALYLVIISVSTVGFGDINPSNDVSKAIVMLMICALMAIVPRELNALGALMDRTSAYDPPFTPQPEAGHVVLCGKPSSISVKMFLQEFYHLDHGEQLTRVVILDPDEPSEAMVEVIEDPMYSGEVKYVQYVKGSVMSVNDLFKVLAFEATCIFIFSNQFTDNISSSDLDCILASKAIGSLVDMERPGVSIPTYFQLLKSSTTDHCSWATSSDSKNAIAQNICIETLKMGLIATSVRCPGFSTLLSNLIVSTGEAPESNEEWIGHYSIGYGQEIYAGIDLSPYFLGWTFAEMAAEAFKKYGVCVFAITLPAVDSIDQEQETFVNPVDYILLGVEKCCLIADDISEARSFSVHIPPRKKPAAKDIISGQSKGFAPVKVDAEGEKPLENHIILCGKFFGLRSFMEPLRTVSNQPVLILHPEPLSEEDQETVDDLPDVHFKLGSPLLLQDLVAAGAGTCDTVVIFSDYTGYFFTPVGGHTTDTFTLYVASAIDANFSCRWMIEAVDGGSMRFLPERPDDPKQEHSLYPQYCAGSVYFANIFDSLMAQAFYNDSLIEIITTLIHGGDVKDEDGAPREFVVQATAENPLQDQIIVCPVEKSVVRLLQVPKVYVGNTYASFFSDLMLNHGCLPLGLYCGVEDDGDNRLPFVFCNPPQHMLLHQEDKVYVLSGNEFDTEFFNSCTGS